MKTPLLPLACALALAAAGSALADPALTIYNQNFAVVRDTVPLELKAGANEARFSGTTAQVEADSVILRDPTGKVALRVLEQNYRNDPVSEPMLLSLFEGQVLEFVAQEPQKPDRVIKGKVIRSGYVPGGENVSPIIEVDGQMQFQLPGQPRFPSLGNDTVLKPSLTWRLEAPAAAKLDAELAYLTQGFSWSASYNVVAPEKSDLIDLVGWVTVKNESGATFTNAKLKLMAGDVNKVQPPQPMPMMRGKAMMEMAMADGAAPAVTEKTFDEYHLYTIARPTTLHDKETKQVEFTRATGVKAPRLYVYDGAQVPFMPGMQVGGDPGYGTESRKKVSVFRELLNSEANKLGMPLPKGRIRLYQQDGDGQMEFIGENEIDHTPKDETIRFFVGDSFDLVGERKQVNFEVNEPNHRASETFEIKLRNRKKEPVEIRVVEHLYRWSNWEIKASQAFEKKDSQTIEFRVPVKPDEEKTLTYTVRYSW